MLICSKQTLGIQLKILIVTTYNYNLVSDINISNTNTFIYKLRFWCFSIKLNVFKRIDYRFLFLLNYVKIVLKFIFMIK